MREFAYARARDVDAAVSLVADNPGARYLGGGTNLVDLMKLGIERPELLVDVTGLPLDEVTEDGDLLRIGALVRNSDLAAHPLVRDRYPVLSQAVLNGASGQLRNVATTGGNLVQRTRCGYFTDPTKPCNKRMPGSGCPAIEGEHHNLAILGASDHCVATHPSDLAVALAALDARIDVQDLAGPHELPLEDLYRPVGDRPDLELTIRDGALITGVALPPLPPDARTTYRKVRERASYAFAIAAVAAVLVVRDGLVSDVRIALGAVASHPWRARIAERELRGGPATAAAFEAAAIAELDAARPLRDNAYKVPLVRDLVVAVLTELAR
ncbi:xanthine dehydrogenase YagS FAD-binding subunit [Asanoa hainanensis]|uniref:Xanthine dehydrogenase YagS FAD-binding subunit n=1 Tax=Asanoa hainanensis TaxID=560556 RepID=A0A239PAH3_9ACTN|nr:xanthine dehydrogenase family protein subunit M [Asanoa hainanensis]SNT63704.1 xanthine dehydrogenase YagS FAD-binding subunit [Asanoa hainanensis]